MAGFLPAHVDLVFEEQWGNCRTGHPNVYISEGRAASRPCACLVDGKPVGRDPARTGRMTKLHNKSQWHRRARAQLRMQPLCEWCLREGNCSRGSDVARTRMVVQTRSHASYQIWEIGAGDSGPYAVSGLP
jgi:hypothetical protein